jgi:hypothetical protein
MCSDRLDAATRLSHWGLRREIAWRRVRCVPRCKPDDVAERPQWGLELNFGYEQVPGPPRRIHVRLAAQPTMTCHSASGPVADRNQCASVSVVQIKPSTSRKPPQAKNGRGRRPTPLSSIPADVHSGPSPEIAEARPRREACRANLPAQVQAVLSKDLQPTRPGTIYPADWRARSRSTESLAHPWSHICREPQKGDAQH